MSFLVMDSCFELAAILEMARDTPCFCDVGTQSEYSWCPYFTGKDTREEVRYGHQPWKAMVMITHGQSPVSSWTQTVSKRTPLISGPSVHEVSHHFSGPWDVWGGGGEGHGGEQ